MKRTVVFRSVGGRLYCVPPNQIEFEDAVVIADNGFDPVQGKGYLCNLRRANGGSTLTLGGKERRVYFATPVHSP